MQIIEKEIQVLLAGDIAEYVFIGHESLDPASIDAAQAKTLAESLYESIDQVEGNLSRLSYKTEETLKLWWHAIELLAEALLRTRDGLYGSMRIICARGVHEEFIKPWRKRPS